MRTESEAAHHNALTRTVPVRKTWTETRTAAAKLINDEQPIALDAGQRTGPHEPVHSLDTERATAGKQVATVHNERTDRCTVAEQLHAACTASRIGEVSGCRVGDIDTEQWVWTLRRHDLRHTGLTWLADSGVPLHQLQRIAGHTDPRITQRYLHPDIEALRAAGVKLSRHLSGADGPKVVPNLQVAQ